MSVNTSVMPLRSQAGDQAPRERERERVGGREEALLIFHPHLEGLRFLCTYTDWHCVVAPGSVCVTGLTVISSHNSVTDAGCCLHPSKLVDSVGSYVRSTGMNKSTYALLISMLVTGRPGTTV